MLDSYIYTQQRNNNKDFTQVYQAGKFPDPRKLFDIFFKKNQINRIYHGNQSDILLCIRKLKFLDIFKINI